MPGLIKLLAILAFCLPIHAAMGAEEWQNLKIEKFEMRGGDVSDWIQKWIEEAEKAGAPQLGFDGVKYLYPLKDRSVGPAFIDFKNAPMITVLRSIADACMFDFRIRNNHVLIQPDRI